MAVFCTRWWYNGCGIGIVWNESDFCPRIVLFRFTIVCDELVGHGGCEWGSVPFSFHMIQIFLYELFVPNPPLFLTHTYTFVTHKRTFLVHELFTTSFVWRGFVRTFM